MIGRRKERFEHCPFGTGQIAWQSKAARAYCARVVSVHILDFLGSLQNLRISDLGWRQANPLTLLNLISDQALDDKAQRRPTNDLTSTRFPAFAIAEARTCTFGDQTNGDV